MSEGRYKISFASARRRPTCNGVVSLPEDSGKAETVAQHVDSKNLRPVGRVARLLALAHYVERQIEAGVIKDYAAAAWLLGISRGRMSQVMDLRLLPPQAQEEILAGGGIVSERRLRSMSNQFTG